MKSGRSQQEIQQINERLKSMECHEAVFVEPMPNYDLQRTSNWGEIAEIIFKAHEKEKNSASNPDSKPEQRIYKPYQRMKECANCCEYLLNDLQIENILDMYELRQDRSTKDKQMREAVQKTLDI